jgi:hypothetical protein
MSIKSKIYFISAGTSKKDLDKKAKKNDLTYNGFKELINLRENSYFKNNILYNANTDFLVSANVSCVESALILFSDSSKKTVSVFPYLNTERNDKLEYTKFFKGNIDRIRGNSHYLETLSFGLNQNLGMLIKDFPNINYDLNANINIYKFNSNEFITLLEDMISVRPGRNIVVLCQSYAVKTLLSKMQKFINIRKEKIENSSIFEIDVEVEINPPDTTIKYDFCTKIYPTISNYKPLMYKNERFYYDLGSKNIPLFDTLKDGVPINLLKKETVSTNKSNNIILFLNKSEPKNSTDTNTSKISFKNILIKLQPSPTE